MWSMWNMWNVRCVSNGKHTRDTHFLVPSLPELHCAAYSYTAHNQLPITNDKCDLFLIVTRVRSNQYQQKLMIFIGKMTKNCILVDNSVETNKNTETASKMTCNKDIFI